MKIERPVFQWGWVLQFLNKDSPLKGRPFSLLLTTMVGHVIQIFTNTGTIFNEAFVRVKY